MKTKKTLFILLVAFSKLIEITTNTNNIGSRRLKTQGTKRPIPQYNKELYKYNKEIREDVETRPIEVNFQSAGVSEEKRVFFTEEDNETEQKIWERKQQSKKGLMVPATVIQIDAISQNTVEEITNFMQKVRRTNQILLEQSRDPILLQMKAKLQKEEYSEEILQQDGYSVQVLFKQYRPKSSKTK